MAKPDVSRLVDLEMRRMFDNGDLEGCRDSDGLYQAIEARMESSDIRLHELKKNKEEMPAEAVVAERLSGAKERLLTAGLREWDGESGILLIPHTLFDKVPEGARLTTITGVPLIKGKDKIDLDTRHGLLALGVTADQYIEALLWFGA